MSKRRGEEVGSRFFFGGGGSRDPNIKMLVSVKYELP